MFGKTSKYQQVLEWKIEGPKKKVGHSESTQIWVDTKCPISWKRWYFHVQKNIKILTNVGMKTCLRTGWKMSQKYRYSWKKLKLKLNLLTAGRGKSFISSRCMSCILIMLIFSSFDTIFPLGLEIFSNSFVGGPKSFSFVFLIASSRRFCSALFRSRLVRRAQNPHGNVFLFLMCLFRPKSDTKIVGQCGHFL